MKAFLALVLVCLLAGCNSSYRTITQADDSRAYLQLNGNFFGTQLVIDNNSPLNLVEGEISVFKLDGRTVAKFEVSTGSHKIEIIRNNKTVVNRKIYVSNGNTFEVEVK